MELIVVFLLLRFNCFLFLVKSEKKLKGVIFILINWVILISLSYFYYFVMKIFIVYLFNIVVLYMYVCLFEVFNLGINFNIVLFKKGNNNIDIC